MNEDDDLIPFGQALSDVMRTLRVSSTLCRVQFKGSERCDQLASYEMICRCCHVAVPCCVDHEQEITSCMRVRCTFCKTVDAGEDLFAFFEAAW